MKGGDPAHMNVGEVCACVTCARLVDTCTCARLVDTVFVFPTYVDRGTLAPSLVKPLISSNANETRKRDIGVELTVSGHSPTINQDEDLPKPKNPSRDAPLRWGSLLVFMVVVIAFIVVLVVMVGIN